MVRNDTRGRRSPPSSTYSLIKRRCFARTPQQVPGGVDGRHCRADSHARGENVHEKLGLVVRVRDIHVRAEGEQTERQAVQQRRARARGGESLPRRSRVLPQGRQVGDCYIVTRPARLPNHYPGGDTHTHPPMSGTCSNRRNRPFITRLNVFSVQRDDIGAHINVGRTYNHLKMYKEAEDAYLEVT